MPPSHIKNPTWIANDEYTLKHLHSTSETAPSNDALAFALSNQEKRGLPDIAVSPAQGKFLMLQAKLLRAKNVLEIGTLGGYSTLWMASASPDIRIISLEVHEKHAEAARANLENAGVGDRVEVRVGPGIESLPGIKKEIEEGKRGKFELVFIDADKENNWNYVDTVISMCHPGACIIVDNIVRGGMLANFKLNDDRIMGARRVVEMVGKDERLDGVVLQLVGEKSYDGILMSIVK